MYIRSRATTGTFVGGGRGRVEVEGGRGSGTVGDEREQDEVVGDRGECGRKEGKGWEEGPGVARQRWVPLLVYTIREMFVCLSLCVDIFLRDGQTDLCQTFRGSSVSVGECFRPNKF